MQFLNVNCLWKCYICCKKYFMNTLIIFSSVPWKWITNFHLILYSCPKDIWIVSPLKWIQCGLMSEKIMYFYLIFHKWTLTNTDILLLLLHSLQKCVGLDWMHVWIFIVDFIFLVTWNLFTKLEKCMHLK